MRILIIGGGGREHALSWKVSQSSLVTDIFVVPGNAGISKIAKVIDIPLNDFRGLANFAERYSIDLTIVGPEEPLANGIADFFQKRGLLVFGPNQNAAQIEASKVFAKQFMKKFHIPTASFVVFDNPEQALKFVEEHSFPIVIKTDGLAGGKGAIVAKNLEEAKEAIVTMMIERMLGDAGKTVVIEEYLEGYEISLMAITDGTDIVPLLATQDFKRAYDGNEGPNTGGMGSIAPHPKVSEELKKQIMEDILKPTVDGLRSLGTPFKGILYAGVMLTKFGPKVLEFNCRFGDPETQSMLALLESDLVEMILFALENRITEADIVWKNKFAVCVVVSSGGYPKKYKKGFLIKGLDDIPSNGSENSLVFHAGTAKRGESFITDGGRVVNCVGIGKTISEAAALAYSSANKIEFEKAFFRTDIAVNLF
jgi:phosphoribosylamine---glycine ligase